MKTKILIAGIGGASLGTEILKCLLLTDKYMIYGCDISKYAFGLYQPGFEKTVVIDRNQYIESVINICIKEDIHYIIPGGEEPMVLLSEKSSEFKDEDILLAANSSEVIKKFSDKKTTFQILAELGFPVPKTFDSQNINFNNISFPVIVKPSTGSGGSSFVFLAANQDEALLYYEYLLNNGKNPIIQEYIYENEGEFTVGVLSLPNGEIAYSVALKRLFNSKLSTLVKSKVGLISSGYSQGFIGEFPEICGTAERISAAVQSKGPLNIQGRIKDGVFYPFEINPRFSASTYLRAMAGVNEIDMFLDYLITGQFEKPAKINEGYYLRSLSEIFIGKENLIVNG